MGCIYEPNNGGKCFFAEDQMNNLVPKDQMPEGCSDDGYCTASDDPDPSWCSNYEPDGSGWDETEPDEESDIYENNDY